MNSLSIFLGAIGPMQVIVVIALIVLLFGGKKIPELMKGIGSGIKEFKNAAKDDDQPANSRKEEEEKNKE
jgi:sec-independent protein translocase protein TatA